VIAFGGGVGCRSFRRRSFGGRLFDSGGFRGG